MIRRLRARSRPAGLAATALQLECLEGRQLLAGNIDVLQSGDNVFLFGDDLANNAELEVSNGNLVLTGNDGTTINGGSSPFTIRSGSTRIDGSLNVRLFAGNDTFVLRGQLTIGDHLKVNAGSGDDSLGVENATIEDNLWLLAGDGNDQVAWRNTTVGDWAHLNLGDGDDTVSAQAVAVGDHLIIVGGRGAEAIVLEQSTIGDHLIAIGGSGNDTFSIVGSTLRKHLIAPLGSSDDFMSLDGTTVSGKLIAVGGQDDDSVVLNGNTRIGRKLAFFAGGGNDALQTAASVVIGNASGPQSSVESNTVPQSLITARLDAPQTGANARAEQARTAVGFAPATPLTLSVSTSSNTTVPSRETLLTTDASFTITGSTLAGATIEIARDGDDNFNDGTTTADGNGNFSIDVTLTHNDANRGNNPIVVRARDSSNRTATQSVAAHLVVGTVVRITTNLGFIDAELLDSDAPTFVANFMNYFSDYADSIVHRLTRVASDGLGVIQGGGFTVSGTTVTAIAPDAPLNNDFDPDNPHIRGSLSMARLGGQPNSATSQWFINTTANPTLDAQQFTVFGHVIPSSLVAVDAITALSEFDVADLTGVSALNETPLQNYALFSVPLAGTVATTAGSTTITGTGTSFTTAIPGDNRIQIAGQAFDIASVASDTELTLATAPTTTASGQTARVNAQPNSTQYVTVSSVAEVPGLN
jgi:cyclophilin family peptidyl-prolyl cis-trans isomerase